MEASPAITPTPTSSSPPTEIDRPEAMISAVPAATLVTFASIEAMPADSVITPAAIMFPS